jgi:2-methylaconitate cis-trans-isomerase PrpF
MTAAVGPFAVDEGILIPTIQDHGGQQKATVRVYNTNTDKIIHCEFSVRGSVPRFESVGDYAIDGVPGFGSRISLSFISPGGAKTGRTLPTANAVDIMNLKIGANPASLSLKVSLVDVGNPAVIIKSDDIGVSGTVLPTDLDADQDKMELLELIRREGARMMGMDPTVNSIPKMVLVSAPPPSSEKVNLFARVLSMRQVHKAIPLTIALNLGVACHISGALPHTLMKGPVCDGRIMIGHPSGKIEVGARMQDGDVESAILHRTARPLMKGEVYWR